MHGHDVHRGVRFNAQYMLKPIHNTNQGWPQQQEGGPSYDSRRERKRHKLVTVGLQDE